MTTLAVPLAFAGYGIAGVGGVAVSMIMITTLALGLARYAAIEAGG